MTQGDAMRNQRNSIVSGLNGSTELRLHNQLERAYQNCFGAEHGLRVLVQLATSQMLATGASRRSIQEALTRVVLDHPGREAHKSSVGNGQSRAAALTAMMLQWSERTDVAAERQA